MFALTWKGEVSLGDLGSVVALVALVFACWQFWQKARVERARFLVEMANLLMDNKEAENIFYTILEGAFKFNPPAQLPRNTEKAIDTLLFQLNLIGHLLKMKIINRKDVGFFKKEAETVLLNDEVRKYMSSMGESWWPGAVHWRTILEKHLNKRKEKGPS